MTTWLNRRGPPPVARVTVIVAEACRPSQLAVTSAPPAETPVTRPFASTRATFWSADDQDTARPRSETPLVSLQTAVSRTVAPTATLAVLGLTTTLATGSVEAGAVGPDPLEPQPASARSPAAHTTPRPTTRKPRRIVHVIASALPRGHWGSAAR